MTLAGEFDWYFDFISPFAYLQHCKLRELQAVHPDLRIRYHPVLFAGLLAHHEQKGPAEIASKRLMTYRYCHWLAEKNGTAFRMPAAHPFNPLPFLRLAIARNLDPEVIHQLFVHCWSESADDPGFALMDRIASLPGLEDADTLCAQEGVKAALRHNTEQAIARGVFGVPTIAVDTDLFWGLDMTEMAIARLGDSELFREPEYQRITTLPIGKARS